MEVWVRSQDKNRFAQARNFSYDYEVNKHIVYCNGYPYGVYNSKERCLEIIDEIQSLFCDFLVCRDVDFGDLDLKKELGLGYLEYHSRNLDEPTIEYHERSIIVYEMPKE